MRVSGSKNSRIPSAPCWRHESPAVLLPGSSRKVEGALEQYADVLRLRYSVDPFGRRNPGLESRSYWCWKPQQMHIPRKGKTPMSTRSKVIASAVAVAGVIAAIVARMRQKQGSTTWG